MSYATSPLCERCGHDNEAFELWMDDSRRPDYNDYAATQEWEKQYPAPPSCGCCGECGCCPCGAEDCEWCKDESDHQALLRTEYELAKKEGRVIQ